MFFLYIYFCTFNQNDYLIKYAKKNIAQIRVHEWRSLVGTCLRLFIFRRYPFCETKIIVCPKELSWFRSQVGKPI